MVTSMAGTVGMGDTLRERLPALWRRIESAHYSYLETDDSPEKLIQRKKLEGHIVEYLSLVPHECKFGLSETGKVFERTLRELPEFSAYRAGLGWAALARYAANLLAQPWRKEYKTIRLYCGYYKHEIEANMVGAETLLLAMGYKPSSASGRLELHAPVCPDMVAAVSRDAIIAHAECQIMTHIWEAVWNGGARATWSDVARERRLHAGGAAKGARRLAARLGGRPMADVDDIYTNVAPSVSDPSRIDPRYQTAVPNCNHIDDESPLEEPITMLNQYVVPTIAPPMVYPCTSMNDVVPVMAPYGVPYYYPAPYMIPTPVYAPIKHANNIPVNGYPIPQYRYPSVPTGQLIELESPYENGKHHKEDERHRRRESSRRNSTSRSGFSDVTLPSIPRSDTQPALSKAREDGMGTYESWDYVFRNLSSKEDDRSRFSPSLDRDSRTLDRLDRDERRAKYQPTTLDLEDGLQALNLDRTHDEDAYRTAKVNESLMRLKQEQELKRVKQMKKVEMKKKIESVPNPKSDGLVTPKVAPDKVKLLTKKDVKDRIEVLKQQNGGAPSVAEARKMKKPLEKIEKRPLENGHASHSVTNVSTKSYDPKTQLVVSLDQPDARTNGSRPPSRTSTTTRTESRADSRTDSSDKWQCATCTYLNRAGLQACEMCGKSKRGPEIQPLTSGGKECPACTLVNVQDARVCEACNTSLEHCPTYI